MCAMCDMCDINMNARGMIIVRGVAEEWHVCQKRLYRLKVTRHHLRTRISITLMCVCEVTPTPL
jgi:hypothetical protein